MTSVSWCECVVGGVGGAYDSSVGSRVPAGPPVQRRVALSPPFRSIPPSRNRLEGHQPRGLEGMKISHSRAGSVGWIVSRRRRRQQWCDGGRGLFAHPPRDGTPSAPRAERLIPWRLFARDASAGRQQSRTQGALSLVSSSSLTLNSLRLSQREFEFTQAGSTAAHSSLISSISLNSNCELRLLLGSVSFHGPLPGPAEPCPSSLPPSCRPAALSRSSLTGPSALQVFRTAPELLPPALPAVPTPYAPAPPVAAAAALQ